MLTTTERAHFVTVNGEGWRISRHAINKALDPERAAAQSVDEAIQIITEILEFPSARYRSKRFAHQHKYHDRDGRLVLAVDESDNTVVTVFVSGHRKVDGKEVV